jgi:GNAT superfamily N-acetyltransferase
VSDPLRSLLDKVAAGRNPAPDGANTVLGRPAGGKLVGAVLGFTAHHVIAADVDPDWLRRTLPVDLGAPLRAPFLAALGRRLDAAAGTLDVLLLAPRAYGPAPDGGPAGPGGGPGGPGGGVARGGAAVPGGGPHGAAAGGGGARLAGRGGPGVRHLAATTRVSAEPAAAALPGGLRALPDGVGHPRLARAHRYRDDVRGYTVDGGLLLLGRGLAGRWEVAVEVDPAYRGRGIGRHLVGLAAALVPPGQPVWAQVAPGNVASMRAFLAAGYRPVGVEVLFPVPRWEGAE